MKMFKTIAAIAAALLVVITFSVASLTSADAAGTDTGPCITAVWKDDPTITAQRGDCAVETPVSTVVGYSTNVRIGVNDPVFANSWFNIKIWDAETGEQVFYESLTADANGFGEIQFTAYREYDSSVTEPVWTYGAMIDYPALGGQPGGSTGLSFGVDDYTDLTAPGTDPFYSLTGDVFFIGHEWVKRFG
jgi:hypothetical protein